MDLDEKQAGNQLNVLIATTDYRPVFE